MLIIRLSTIIVVLFAITYLGFGQERLSNNLQPSLSPVTWERLVNAANEPHNWLMYSGTLDSQRFSRLDQIQKRNVSDLKPAMVLSNSPD